jgi:hypothetical protein
MSAKSKSQQPFAAVPSDARLAWLRRAEWGVAALITGIAGVIHIANLRHAGGLWRDEAAAVHLAQMPSFAAIWTHIEHESFPLLLTMLIRAWSAVGLGDDFGLRSLGLLIGLAVLAAFWFGAWRFSATPPLIALVVFGLNPTAIRWGDSLRAYGLGVLFILLAAVAVWTLARSPSRHRLVFAMIAGVLAVQSLYQNAFILAVICLAGAVVAAMQRDWRRALLVIAAGVPAAVSLLPYVSVVRRASEWNMATQMPIDLARIWTVLHRALSAPGPLMFWLWVALFLAAVAIALILLVRPQLTQARGSDNRQVAAFFLTLIGGITCTYYIFLKVLNFPSEVWYYLVWMAVIALAIDVLISRVTTTVWLRLVRIGTAGVAAALLVPGAWRAVEMRMTNLDLVAAQLNSAVAAEDLVIVQPWFCAASFQRYYTGPAELTTLPPLSDYGLQRLDLFKAQIAGDDPARPVLEKLEGTLRNGHTVWLIGHFPFSNPPQPPPTMLRGGEGPEGWRGEPYMIAYGMEEAYFIQSHATRSTAVEVPVEQQVNPFENLPVRTISGWRRAWPHGPNR